jgi:hypothetical protein
MIKGLAITPPVIGRISIGKLVQKQERWLPEKDDSFSFTTQVQSRDGWLLHPLHQALSEQAQNGKIRAIPIQLLFNDSELNLRAEYSAFDRNNGRPVCVGNGETARRVTSQGMEEIGVHGSRPLSAGQGAGLQAVWSAQCPGGRSAG